MTITAAAANLAHLLFMMILPKLSRAASLLGSLRACRTRSIAWLVARGDGCTPASTSSRRRSSASFICDMLNLLSIRRQRIAAEHSAKRAHRSKTQRTYLMNGLAELLGNLFVRTLLDVPHDKNLARGAV